MREEEKPKMNLLTKLLFSVYSSVMSLVKIRLWIFLSLIATMAIASSSFVSCSAFDGQSSTNQASTNNNNEDDDDDSDDDDDDDDDRDAEECEDDEGDLCKGNETCEEICESIYEEFDEKRLCMNRGDETVGKLEKVHNLLMGSKAGTGNEQSRTVDKVEDDLRKIGDEDDDDGVSRDDFKCYVQIGVTKWITQIKKGLGPEDTSGNETLKRGRLLKTIKWLVEDDEESAEILKDDINEGDDILEALLLTLSDGDLKLTTGTNGHHGDKLCIAGSAYNDATSVTDEKVDIDIWWFSGNDLKIRYYDKDIHTGEIELGSSQDKTLYNALSCMQDGDLDLQNIFSYSAENENSHIFDLAFDLLSDVCSDVENPDDRSAGCARALMCWTAWQNSCGVTEKGDAGTCGDSDRERPNNSDNNKLWEHAKDHSSSLEKDDSNYNQCATKHFADFF